IALEHGEPELVALSQMVRQLRRHALVAISVSVGIVAERNARLRGVEALGVEVADVEAEVRGAERASDAGAEAARAIGADARIGARGGRVLRSLGEYLDHAADCIGAVKAAQLAGHDFDALDLRERN